MIIYILSPASSSPFFAYEDTNNFCRFMQTPLLSPYVRICSGMLIST